MVLIDNNSITAKRRDVAMIASKSYSRKKGLRLFIIFSIVGATIYYLLITESKDVDENLSLRTSQIQKSKTTRTSNNNEEELIKKDSDHKIEVNDACIGPVSLEPSSDIESIFNCGSDSGLCHYYYPAKFYSSCGVGREYLHLVNETETKRMDGSLWNNMPSIGFPTISLSDKNLSMIHVHKSGGSSLHAAFNEAASRSKNKLKRHHWYFPARGPDTPKFHSKKTKVAKKRKENDPDTPKVHSKNENVAKHEKEYKDALNDIRYAVRYPASFDPHDHVMFAVIREPTERFISSIGQAMGASGSTGNGIAKEFQNECIQNTTSETLRCCIDYVQKHTFWAELHFTPQSLEVSFATIWQDIPVAVFDFQDLPKILSNLGLDPNKKLRDGKQNGYRANKILAALSVKDYDEQMLRDVCNLYRVDVLMRRVAGLKNPTCDRFID